MAQNSNDILNQILGVCVKINKQLEGSGAKSGGKTADKGTGGTSSFLGKETKKNKLKEGVGLFKDITMSLLTLGKISINSKKLSTTTKGISVLIDLFKDAGRSEKSINRGIDVFNKIIESLKEGAPTVEKYSKTFSSFFKTIGLGILLIAGGLWAAGKLLGAKNMGQTFLIIAGVVLGFIGIMWLMAKAAPYVKEGIETAKNMSKAMAYLGIGLVVFTGSLLLTGIMLGTGSGPKGVLMGAGLLVAVIGGMGLVFWGLSKFSTPIEKGVDTAGIMAIGLIALSAGILVFTLAAKAITNMGDENATKKDGSKKGKFGQMMSEIGPGLGMMGIILVSSALLFAGLGYLLEPIGLGVVTAVLLTIGLVAVSLGIMAVAKAAKTITNMGDKTATKADGSKKGKFGQMMGEIGPGLGAMGIILVSSALLFMAIGLPVVAPFVLAGAVTAMAVGGALVVLASSVSAMMKASETFKDKDVKGTINTMTESVLSGFINGVSTALSGGQKGLKGLATGIKNSVIIMDGIAMLMGISVALSMFAKALTAFADLGNMKVIESYDPVTGEPKFGPTVDVKNVGTIVTSTISEFLKALISSTETLTMKQAKALKKMGRALTGERGILSAVIQFADVLKTFAQFGPEGKIGYVDMVPDGVDQDGNAKFKQIPKTVKIAEVSKNIANSFGTFIRTLVEETEGVVFSSENKKSMLNLSEALMGKKRGLLGKVFAGDKPGLLEPITKFADTLTLYAKFGEKNELPIIDPATGAQTGTINMTTIASNIAKAITGFSAALTTEMQNVDHNSVKGAGKQMEKYSELITQLGELSNAQEGLMNTSNAVNELAKSIGNLAGSLNDLNTDKLGAISKVKVQRNEKGVGSSMQRITSKPSVNYEDQEVENNKTSKSSANNQNQEKTSTNYAESANNSTTNPANIDKLVKEIKISNKNMETLMSMIANQNVGGQVSSAFKNAQFKFDFQNNTGGVLTLNKT